MEVKFKVKQKVFVEVNNQEKGKADVKLKEKAVTSNTATFLKILNFACCQREQCISIACYTKCLIVSSFGKYHVTIQLFKQTQHLTPKIEFNYMFCYSSQRWLHFNIFGFPLRDPLIHSINICWACELSTEKEIIQKN